MIDPRTGEPLAGKPSPEMFDYALSEVPIAEGMGEKTAHFDDQFKGFWGADRAGIERGVWTYPRGRQHKGVLAFRPLEVPAGFAFIAVQRAAGKRSMK